MSDRARIKPGKASLIGGIAVGVASLALWVAIAHELAADSVAIVGLGVVVAAGVATWIRLADL
jgi:hypothetical protein